MAENSFDSEDISQIRISIQESCLKYGNEDNKSVQQLMRVHDRILDMYDNAIQWYTKKRKSHRRFSQWYRRIGIVCASLAAIWPAFQLVGGTQLLANFLSTLAPYFSITVTENNGRPTLLSDLKHYVDQAGYLAAAIGVAVLWADHYGGSSISWIRHMRAVSLLQAESARRQVEWNSLLTRRASQDELREHLEQMIRNYSSIVDRETLEWSRMYIDGLSNLSQNLDHARFSGGRGRDDQPAADDLSQSSPITQYASMASFAWSNPGKDYVITPKQHNKAQKDTVSASQEENVSPNPNTTPQ